MLNCIAVDDEPLALGLLQDNISKVPFLNLVASCGDAFEAMKVLQEKHVDLVFIDIQMPGITGLQFIESLTQKPMFILVTAYKQFALESYSLDVVDYLVKPVSIDRFLKACNKAMALHELKNKETNSIESDTDYFFLNVDYSLLKIKFDDIEWIEGLRDYIKINMKNSNKPVVARNSMGGMEKTLPSKKFIRIHKSFILSIDCITSIKKNSAFIKEHEFPIGESYKDAVLKMTGKE